MYSWLLGAVLLLAEATVKKKTLVLTDTSPCTNHWGPQTVSSLDSHIKTQHRQHRLGREGQEDLKWEGVLGATDISATVWQCLSYFQWKTGCWMQAEPIMPEVYHWNKLSLAVKFTLLVNFWGCQNLTAYVTQWWTLTESFRHIAVVLQCLVSLKFLMPHALHCW